MSTEGGSAAVDLDFDAKAIMEATAFARSYGRMMRMSFKSVLRTCVVDDAGRYVTRGFELLCKQEGIDRKFRHGLET